MMQGDPLQPKLGISWAIVHEDGERKALRPLFQPFHTLHNTSLLEVFLAKL